MTQMMPIIMDTGFTRLGLVDDYISFIWSTRYYECGDFELVVSTSSENIELLKKDYYVVRDDREDVGIIETISITKDHNNQEIMVVSGRFLSSILGRRIIAVQTEVSGTVAACVQKLVRENAINPSIAARRIPGLTFGTFTNAAVSMEQQFTGTNLLEAIQEICQNNGCGFKTVLNDSNQFVFSLFDGVDRSYGQDANPYVVFSSEYENLEASDYEENYSKVVTDVLVAGEGEGLERKTAWATKQSLTGMRRYELFKDARNSSTNNGEIPLSTYLAQLKVEGMESISTIEQAFAGTVSFDNVVFGVDVGIGDICVIENQSWGVQANVRIIEIIESMSEAGVYTVTPTFAQMITEVAPTDENLYLQEDSPARLELMAENGRDVLLQEGAVFDLLSSPYESAKQVSELDEIAAPADSHWFLISTPTESNKLSYSSLKADMMDYDNLANKPLIENVTLQGNKTFSALGLNYMTNQEIDSLLT